MDSLSCGIPARFQKAAKATFNYPYNIPASGHDNREIAVTMPRNVGHALAKSPVTITRNTQARIDRPGGRQESLSSVVRVRLVDRNRPGRQSGDGPSRRSRLCRIACGGGSMSAPDYLAILKIKNQEKTHIGGTAQTAQSTLHRRIQVCEIKFLACGSSAQCRVFFPATVWQSRRWRNGAFATGDPDSEAPAERSNTLAWRLPPNGANSERQA